MKTTGTLSLTYNPTATYSVWGWTQNGQVKVLGNIVRKGRKIIIENLRYQIYGMNIDTVSGSLSGTFSVSTVGIWHSDSQSMPARTADTKVLSFGNPTWNVGTNNSSTVSLYITFRASQSGTIFRQENVTVNLPAYTPPTYGSVGGQSKFIDTLYGAIPDVTSMTISPTFPAYNTLVTNINPVTMGGALVDPNIYSTEGAILDTLSLDYNHSSGDLMFAFNLHEVGDTTPIQEIQDIDTPANLETTLADYGITIDPNFSSGSDMSYIININPTYSRYKSKKLLKLYGSVNGKSKRIY